MHCHQLISAAAVAAAVLTLSACATVTKGSNQGLTVTTDPVGASCLLTRDGTAIAAVGPTPQTANFDKGASSISLTCRKEGYIDANLVIESEFQEMTLGNILIGGIVGIAVDAASGAMHKYPTSVNLTLVPNSFPSVAERDAFFDKLRADLMRKADQALEQVNKSCTDRDCERQRRLVESARNEKLAGLDVQQQAARVR